MNDNILDQKISRYIKAIAIIMMVIHHFFAFPDRWLESNLFITGGVYRRKASRADVG